MTITKGQRVFFKPEFSQPGDVSAVYVAVCDSYAHDTDRPRVIIANANSTLAIIPQELIDLHMLTVEG
jgi:hypothetical protein